MTVRRHIASKQEKNAMRLCFRYCRSRVWKYWYTYWMVVITAIWNAGSVVSAAPVFSYDPNADNGPAHWGSLSIDNNKNECDGNRNSPISITSQSSCDRYGTFQFSEGTCSIHNMEFTFTNTGTMASFPSSPKQQQQQQQQQDGTHSKCVLPTVEIPGIPETTFEALQFHIHASSEHTLDGRTYAAELHIVHKQQYHQQPYSQQQTDNQYAVIGILIEVDPLMDQSDVGTTNTNNALFQSLMDHWQLQMNKINLECGIERHRSLLLNNQEDYHAKRQGSETFFSPYDLLPNKDVTSYYHYPGGLTTPPCSEVVLWNIADQPLRISPIQYHQLVHLLLDHVDPSESCQRGTSAGPAGATSRPIVPLNGRIVERICPIGIPNESQGVGSETKIQSSNCQDDASSTMHTSLLPSLAIYICNFFFCFLG